MLDRVIPGLREDNAYVRSRFLLGVEKILEHRLSDQEFSLTATPDVRQTQVDRLLDRYARR